VSGQDELVPWLRQRIRERRYLAERAVELGSAAVWEETSSGVLVTGEPADADAWHGTWAMGDSSLARLMEANDPRDTIARCESELAVLDVHSPVAQGSWTECGECGPNNQGAALIAVPGDGDEFFYFPCKTVRLLGYGYRWRPGYREEWKP
jgi:Family of unknown function (DUF6221)